MLYVFDLDFTLWDCGGTWCDHTYPPYNIRNGKIYDSDGRHIRLYPEVVEIIEELKSEGHTLALASRTGAPEIARKLLSMFDLTHYFEFQEIYPADKTSHFKKLRKKTGFDYSEMFFFDDEHRNIHDVRKLGVNCFFVEDGLSFELINETKLY